MLTPGSIIHRDPRRLGRRPMLAVWCWCGRFFTLTPEAAERHGLDGTNACPDCQGQEAAA